MKRRNSGRIIGWAGVIVACGIAGAMWGAAPARPGAASLGIAGTEATGPVKLEEFGPGLPAARAWPERGPGAGRVLAGTAGLKLASPPRIDGGVTTIAILGDMTTGNPSAEKFTNMAVAELNLLRPELVLTVGNLVPGMGRDGDKYVKDMEGARSALDGLLMPWYPCAGEQDMLGGTRQEDRRFEELYQKYVGPLYYSVDAGDVHAIVLDSEEGGGEIGENQIAWLKEDLNRVFAGAPGAGVRRAQWVIVVMHRPLWREAQGAGAASWKRVQRLLVEFNHRPIVTVEGEGGGGGGGGEARGPRVVAVFAGHERAYSMEPAVDGIQYYVLGPTAAAPRLGEDAAVAVRHLTLVKFDRREIGERGAVGATSGMHPAIVELGGAGAGGDAAIVGEDIIAATDRAVIDQIAGWGNDVIGIDGMIDEVGAPVAGKPLRIVLNNPLKDPIDLTIRTASTRNLSLPWRREEANTFVEGMDLPWELASAHMIRHLVPGAKDGWAIELSRPEDFGKGDGGGPPQVEFVVHWNDSRGRSREVVLKRKVPVVPRAAISVSSGTGEAMWKGAARGNLFAWQIRGDEPRRLAPTWQMAADETQIYVRVRVDDAVRSYWPRMALDSGLGGIASDAVSVAWAAGEGAGTVQRVWVMPFGPKGAEVWTNRGVGEKQTELLRVDPKAGVTASVTESGSGYEVTLSLPRKLVFGEAAGTRGAATRPADITGIMNISVHDNDGGPRTWVRSWAVEDLGPAAWGRVELMDPAAGGSAK